MGTRLRCIAAALLLPVVLQTAVHAQTAEERQARGDAVVRRLNNGQSQPVLDGMRQEFPFLAEATQGYALGDVWSRPQLDNRTRQLATVAVFAAMGEPAFLKVHAGYALNLGASEEELKEIVYLTTVTAGFPRAIAASQALSELFAERRAAQIRR
ncbi:carboxymuconolactone decarboxylase family protein [Bradyrhizobium sp. WBOS7]|uniref:Carboxymuconolactone decarboxylase family protein n=1 Tax=Bradyrhizobium betae TaxID=244734 RepID=A0AAE9NCL4_9BRAD|nr:MULTISPECIES: carboxymuconolactone decarboxylase family protein [Bradyrhizobium]MDD1573317.1 carboxymuconolactone decarboxylase family protein [Bradyrhizobium sp. WBOS1]UUO37647.1 carboxymuconolactone decarboxylase family protein [Bradyrhizobium sp. WBOS01]MDD1528201.1 carboxymuconolactone decarboxylase family protein [Bradyrhizobium sp. WBOS2]MDD1578781.1 carboxymuconolactone decarboxylase family protein [Bradyrhizobium sp. WBOS7]MDD1602214.1 carboxymuconolactone decarboxylase family prote